MRKCPQCNVYIDQPAERCPLCSSALINVEGSTQSSESPYPDYIPLSGYHERFPLLARIFLAISLGVCIISIVVNCLTNTRPWSVAVFFGIDFFWAAIALPLMTKLHATPFFPIQAIAVCVFLFAIDCVTGKHGWSYHYVLPILYIIMLIPILTLTFVQKTLWQENLFILAEYSVGGIILFIIAIIIGFDVIWPYWAVLLSAVCVLIGISIFPGKTALQETKKRINI